MGSPILFFILAAIAVVAALGMVLSRNAVYSALFLVLNFMTIAVLYIVLNAPFIAMVQVTVYAGAIMVLFLFVIMLLGAERLGGVAGASSWQRGLAIFLGVAVVATFAAVLIQGGGSGAAGSVVDTSPQALGYRLFEAYLLPFEVTAVLLLTSLIGVVIMGKKKGEKDA